MLERLVGNTRRKTTWIIYVKFYKKHDVCAPPGPDFPRLRSALDLPGRHSTVTRPVEERPTLPLLECGFVHRACRNAT